LIESGIAQGAKLVTGGLGRPTGFERGYYVKPTVFADVRPGMRIAREEIFGPVLSILTYETPEQAIALAEDTRYGLATYIQTRDLERARKIARQVRTGNVYINYPAWDVGVALRQLESAVSYAVGTSARPRPRGAVRQPGCVRQGDERG